MDVETAKTLMFVGMTVAITGFGFILYFLFHHPVEDDVSERLDPMESLTSETSEERTEAVLQELQKGGVIENCFQAPLEKKPTETSVPKNPRWERPEIKVRNDQWYSAFSPPRARGGDSLVGRGVVISRGSSRVTIQLEDGTETRRRAHNLVPTQASWSPR